MTRILSRRRPALVAATALALAAAGMNAARADDYDPWPGIAKDLYAGRTVTDSADAVQLEAPIRAEDAGLVPITMRIPAALAPQAKSLTLVVDKNPAPIVATFSFGPAAGPGERVISTRIRIDMYSNVRAILETEDGKLQMAVKFVKAAGGCSAPALKDADEAVAAIGKMQVRTFEPSDKSAVSEAQVMIRHPNYSGMQMNQLTGLYIPAKFVREMEVRRGGDLVFKMEGGISLSEDPNIRFSYQPIGDQPLEVVAKDTAGSVFTGRSAQKGS